MMASHYADLLPGVFFYKKTPKESVVADLFASPSRGNFRSSEAMLRRLLDDVESRVHQPGWCVRSQGTNVKLFVMTEFYKTFVESLRMVLYGNKRIFVLSLHEILGHLRASSDGLCIVNLSDLEGGRPVRDDVRNRRLEGLRDVVAVRWQMDVSLFWAMLDRVDHDGAVVWRDALKVRMGDRPDDMVSVRARRIDMFEQEMEEEEMDEAAEVGDVVCAAAAGPSVAGAPGAPEKKRRRVMPARGMVHPGGAARRLDAVMQDGAQVGGGYDERL